MKRFLLIIILLLGGEIIADDLYCYDISNSNIHAVVNEKDDEIVIEKLIIDSKLLGSNILYTLERPDVNSNIKKERLPNGSISFNADSFSEGAGTGVKVVIYSTNLSKASITVEFAYEERSLKHTSRSLEVKKTLCSKKVN